MGVKVQWVGEWVEEKHCIWCSRNTAVTRERTFVKAHKTFGRSGLFLSVQHVPLCSMHVLRACVRQLGRKFRYAHAQLLRNITTVYSDYMCAKVSTWLVFARQGQRRQRRQRHGRIHGQKPRFDAPDSPRYRRTRAGTLLWHPPAPRSTHTSHHHKEVLQQRQLAKKKKGQPIEASFRTCGRHTRARARARAQARRQGGKRSEGAKELRTQGAKERSIWRWYPTSWL